MKKLFTLITGFLLLYATGVYAQASSGGSFTIQHDTVNASPSVAVSTTVLDAISAVGTGTTTVTIDWKVIASDFPSDWVPVYSICDNSLCTPGSGLWTPSGGTLSTKTSNPYGVAVGLTPGGDFHMVVDFTNTTSTGCHYMTVRLNNHSVLTDTATETYVVCNSTTGVPTVSKADDILLYPNPAHDEVNIVYDANADIKNIAVYSIIGKVVAVYKVTNNSSANLNLENIPSGIYFARLMNSQGNVVGTRKFTKQ